MESLSEEPARPSACLSRALGRGRYAADLVSPQGKKGNRAAAARSKAAKSPPPSTSRKRVGLVGFGVLFVALFVIVAIAEGIGQPTVPDGAIAVVEGVDDPPGETISKEEYERGLVQAAARQGLREVPPADDPQYELLAEAAESDLILARWVNGEAEERGIEVTDREIDAELETIKEEQFGSEQEFERFLEQSGFTLDEAKDRIRLQLISDAIQQAVLPAEPDVSDDEVETFYDANVQQFEQPETRNVRVILTRTEPEADEALAELGTDPSAEDWERVAKQYSIDEATKSTGGLRQSVVAGQSEPALDDEVFAAAEGELVGPFEGDAGFYVIEVEKITEATTTPVEEASDQIRQTLAATRQQEIAQSFQADFQAKWTARTFCAEGYRIDRCANADPPPDPCTEEVAETQGCDAPVPSTRPIAPGSNTVFGAPAAVGLPQGPQSGQAELPAGGVPPGLAPVPGAPPGTVPPGTAPPGTAPPGTVPPGTAPPAAPPGG